MNATTQTAEEVRAGHIEAMGPELGELFFLLKQDLFRMNREWKEYVVAFGVEGRVELLNRAAGGFASSYQSALWSDVLLGLTRITDRRHSAGNANLTVLALVPLLSDVENGSLLKPLRATLKATKFARDWRNRVLAHRDLAHAQSPKAASLKVATREKVDGALEALGDLLNGIESHYQGGTTFYSMAEYSNGVLGLLYVIHYGLKAKEERRARLAAGEPRADDFEQI